MQRQDTDRAARIRQRIDELGKDLRWVADQVGVSYRTVQYWLSGEKISRPNLVALARALDTAPEWLEDGRAPSGQVSPDADLADRVAYVERQLRGMQVARNGFEESAARAARLDARLTELEKTVAAVREQLAEIAAAQARLLVAEGGRQQPEARASSHGGSRPKRRRAPSG